MPLPSSGGEVTCCWWHLQVQRLQRFTFRFGILRCCISTVNGISSTWHHFWQFMIACTQLWCYYNKTFIHIISILVISKWGDAPPLYPFGMHYLLVLVIQWLHKWFFMIFHAFVWLCDAPTAWMATNKVCHMAGVQNSRSSGSNWNWKVDFTSSLWSGPHRKSRSSQARR